MCFVVLISCDLWNFSTRKKNFPMRRFCAVNNNQLIHDVCIVLFLRYPPFCILFHELEADSLRWTKYKSIFSLTTYSVCTVSCELRVSKISSRACHSISIVTFFSTPLLTREKNPDCRLPAASTYWEPCVSIYCTWLLYGLLYLKNKQVDISTTFCFSETIPWLCDFSDYPDRDEAYCWLPNSKDATLTILVSEADRTAYHEETIAESHDTLQSELEEVYKKNGREIKENWTCL